MTKKAVRRAADTDEALAERYRSIVETAVDGIVTIDAAGTIAGFNPAAERLFGRTAGDVMGLNVELLMPEPFRSAHQGFLTRYLETGTARIIGIGREALAERKDGSTFPIWLSVGEMRVDGQTMFTGIIRDITVSKRGEVALAESEIEARMLATEQAALARIARAVAQATELGALFALVSHELKTLLGAASARVTACGAPGAPTSSRATRKRLAVPIRVGDRQWGSIVVAAGKHGSIAADAEARLAPFAELVAVALGQTAAREELHRRLAQQHALRSFGERALRQSLHEALEGAARVIGETLGAEAVDIWEAASTAGGGILRARHGDTPFSSDVRVRLSEPPLVSMVVRDHVALLADDMTVDERPDVNSGEPHGTAAAVPVTGGGGTWGAIAARSSTPGHFTPDDLVFMGALANVVGAAVDRELFEHAIRHEAMHDPLTGIANRTLLRDRLELALTRTKRGRRRVAVMFFDLNSFKDVNDAHGHAVGDQILTAIAMRLSGSLRPGDTVARLGGDEFVVLCEDVVDEFEAVAIAERLLVTIGEPLGPVQGIAISAAVGINVCAEGANPESALRDAYTAMYRAKQREHGSLELFDAAMRKGLLKRLSTLADLRHAVDRDELTVYYQPIVSLTTGVLFAVEGLVRWRHPKRGILGPSEFIGIAEQTGAIHAIGKLVIEHACRDTARWNAESVDEPPLSVSVNLSARQIGEAALVGDVRASLERWDLPAAQFGLEITESVLLDDNPEHAAQLDELRALGVRLLLDDFGTGYASLAYIHRFDLDVLKIDRSFVAGLGQDARDTTIVTAIATMASTLRLSVVAEGVETREQLEWLKRLGCQYAQGYYFSRPVPAEKLTVLRRTRTRWT